MKLPQIRLQSNFAQIEIKTRSAQQEIQQLPATLEISQPSAVLEINRTPSKLTIDQTKAREDIDLKSISKRIDDAAKKGNKDWLDGIARRSQEGDELMKIENGGDVIPKQAGRNSYKPIKDFNIDWVPKDGGVQIEFDPGNLNINWTVNKPIINSSINKPNIRYSPGEVNVSLKQINSLEIDFVNLENIGSNNNESK